MRRYRGCPYGGATREAVVFSAFAFAFARLPSKYGLHRISAYVMAAVSADVLRAIAMEVVTFTGQVRFVHPEDYTSAFEALLSKLPALIFLTREDAWDTVAATLARSSLADFLDTFGIPDINVDSFTKDDGASLCVDEMYTEAVVHALMHHNILTVSPDASYNVSKADRVLASEASNF